MESQAQSSHDGRQARWAKHNEERRRRILDAALAVLEGAEPGEEFHVQQIAAQAGLNRTVIYRHFADRADLDRAISAYVVEQLTDLLMPAVGLEGSINDVIRRIINIYIDWVVAHPALHRFAEIDTTGPMQDGLDQIAALLVLLIETAVDLLGAELFGDDAKAADPLIHGLVGAVLASVRRWAVREVREPTAEVFCELLSVSVWHTLDGHALRLGLRLDPDQPLERLFSPDAQPDGQDVVTGTDTAVVAEVAVSSGSTG